jgi:hypothetical protein
MNAKAPRTTARRLAPAALLSSLLLFGASACNDSSDPAPIGVADEPIVGEYDALPGVIVAIQRVYGGSGAGGAFRVGDKPKVDFTIARDSGDPLELSTFARGAIMVSGPTENYQRVIASQSDVIANAVKTALGAYTYTFATAIPASFLAPLNDSALLTDGELTGQALIAGTYTVGLELRKDYTIGDTIYRDPGVATADFLFGSATTIVAREVVKNENCTQCHGEVRAHGNNRNHVRSCVLCHTAGSEDGTGGGASDATPGATIDFRVMIHKIHAGAHLPSVLGVTTNANGTRKYDETPVPYQLIGFQNSVHDYSHVGFPVWPSLFTPMPRDAGHAALNSTQQGLENSMRQGPVACAKCHGDPDGAGPVTAPAQGDLIYAQPTRAACASCHDDWKPELPYTANTQTMPAQDDDAACKNCHAPSGDPLAVLDAHRHPLTDTTLAAGLHFDVSAVSEVEGNSDGTFDAGEKIGVTFSVKDAAGNAIAASSLSRIEMALQGPTTNPNMVHLVRVAQAYFSGTGPYTFNVPQLVYLEAVGTSNNSLQTFNTARFPHWNVTGAVTSLWIRSATGLGSTLAAAAPVLQNYVDVTAGEGSRFTNGGYVVLDDANGGQREFLRVQWVEGDRLWFSSQYRPDFPPRLNRAHTAGATVDPVTLTAIPAASYALTAATGAIQENVEFGVGEVIASYTTDFVIPAQYPGALNESPGFDSSWGDWSRLDLQSGTYSLGMMGARGFSVAGFGETTSYTEGANATVSQLLVGSATDVSTVERIASADACYVCHDDIQFHGGSRRGYDTCIQCHGTAGAEDAPRYTYPSTQPTPGTTVDFRTMLHKIHAGNLLDAGANYVVTGNSGTPHTYEHVGFPVTPSGVMQCASCHGSGNDAWKLPADRSHPTGALPARAWRAACGSCHDSASETAHIDVNTSPSGAEACEICHGSGEEKRVERVHIPR